MSDVPFHLLSGNSGLSFDSTLLSPVSFSAYSHCSFCLVFVLSTVACSPDFSVQIILQYFSFKDGHFGMVLV